MLGLEVDAPPNKMKGNSEASRFKLSVFFALTELIVHLEEA